REDERNRARTDREPAQDQHRSRGAIRHVAGHERNRDAHDRQRVRDSSDENRVVGRRFGRDPLYGTPRVIDATMKAALVLSLIANALLVGLLIFKHVESKPAGSRSVAYCDVLKEDLDFFIEGLAKGNDPFFTPIVVRSLG